MTIKLGVVMDDIRTIKYTKDSTFAMLLEAPVSYTHLTLPTILRV